MQGSTADHPQAEATEGPEPRHRVATSASWPWLPLHGTGVLARHPWCPECGAVKAMGAGKGMSLGGLVNLLARLERRMLGHGHRLTEAQRRLIVKGLQARGADDAFTFTRNDQLDALADLVGRSTGVQKAVAESYLRSC